MQVTKETINGKLTLKVVLTTASDAVLFHHKMEEHSEYDTPVIQNLDRQFPEGSWFRREEDITTYRDIVIEYIICYRRIKDSFDQVNCPLVTDSMYDWLIK